MRGRKIRTAVQQRIGGGFTERGRAIRRQLVKGNFLALIVQPLLDVAPGMGNAQHLVVVPEQHDVVGEPAETAEHDVFVAGQRFAGTQCGLPFAFQHRDVAEQLAI